MNEQPSPFDTYLAASRTLFERIVEPLTTGADSVVAESFRSLAAGAAHEAGEWLALNERYLAQHLALCTALARRAGGDAVPPLITPEAGDHRFRSAQWREAYFDFLVQSYLLRARWLAALVDSARLELRAKRKLEFFVRQLVDAMSPANFLWSNPEALRRAADTQGESLARGLRNLAADMGRGLVSTTDDAAFEVGRNLAVTPGAVVFENDFYQLIQYRPATDRVCERPLLIVPPCINKYYILDLQPANSFVRFAVEEGHTVFMMSWRNMPPAMARATWDDYLEQGVLSALATSSAICGGAKVNALGFCVGGTLLASALAVARARGGDPVASLTLLASMIDFSDTGELSVFVDEAYVRRREQDFAQGGLLHGRELTLTFASLRANDLVWRYVVNNYLMGESPEPFDLLYWNADSTNLPGPMYVYYVRNMYLENNLRVPGRLTMCGVPVDIGTLDMPAYVLATRDDHIVPWKTAHASARLLGGRIDFVLGASGHVAGTVNPAWKNRRSYWVHSRLEDDPERWLANAGMRPGSWWAHWGAWLAPHGGRSVPARTALGGRECREIEPAPGRYVKEKAGSPRGAAGTPR